MSAVLALKAFPSRTAFIGRGQSQLIAKKGFSTTAASQPLLRTKLYDLHVELKGKMVPYAGWEMPVQYEDSITASHLHTRTKASLFDVSHMGQVSITGKDRNKFLEKLVGADVQGIAPGSAKLSLLTNEKGGIIDDTVITNMGDHIYMVVNAGCADKDYAHIGKHLADFQSQGGEASFAQVGRSLIALQGPLAVTTLSKLVEEDITSMPFMSAKKLKVGGFDCLVSRCGYTGEDGFEISVAHEDIMTLTKMILSNEDVKPAGLGARDTLRLEAGLCLYGNEMDENIGPVEAGLGWTIAKRRREEGGFLGAETILARLKDPSLVKRKRVGFLVSGPPAREHVSIHPRGNDAVTVGEITSGTFSPVLSKGISMGYVDKELSKVGTELSAKVRGKLHNIVVTKMPFVPANYKK